jgi:lambda family phage minor tail protein L
MIIPSEVQQLEPGFIVELFTLDATAIGGDVARFHGHQQQSSIWWQGFEFVPWPITSAGWDVTTDQPPTPTVSVGNIDSSITALCAAFDDLQGALLLRQRTFAKYLDAANFGGTNPTADPTKMLISESWSIERKSSEDKRQVTFELASPLNFQNVQLPGRQIIAGVCAWLVRGGYRGPYCGYTGPAVAKADDTATSVMAQDVCGGRPTSCKLRFGATSPLSFGGFPAAQLTDSQ